MKSFEGFLSEISTKTNINEDLDQASNMTYPDIWSALGHLQEITEQHGLELPTILTLESEKFGEEVFEIDEGNFLYFCYSLNEDGTYETVSGIFNEDELEEILSD